MIKWMRPSGREIETGEGEEIEAFAKKMKWKRVNPRGQNIDSSKANRKQQPKAL